MHRQVKVVAILLIVEGSLEALMGAFLCVMGPVMMALISSAPPPPSGAESPPPAVFGAIYLVMGGLTLTGGVLKLVAGIRNVSFKSRTLGFVALGSSLLSMASCYCMPTALALGIYGLIVYLNPRSAQAFQLRAMGVPAEQVIAQIEGGGSGYAPPGYPPGGYPPGYPPQY